MKRLLIILILCVGVLSSTFAQTLSNSERRKINYRVLQAVEQYESLLSLNNEDKRSNFIYLFDKQNVMIYNDILGFNSSSRKLSLKTYVDFLSKQRNVVSKVKNLTKTQMYHKADGWHTIVTFQKSMHYIDRNGVLFSSEEYLKADHMIAMDLRYDSNDDCCYISSIDGAIKSKATPLPNKFIVLDRASEAIYKKMYGKDLTFNSYDQAFVPYIDDANVNIDTHVNNKTKAATDSYKYLVLDYKKTYGRLKTRFAITPGKAFKVNSPIAFSKHKSMAIEASVDLGVTFPLGKNSAMGIFAGGGISKSSLSLELNNIEYSCVAGGVHSANEGLKTRKYTLSASEGISYMDAIVPLYIGFEHCLVKNILHLVWNVGAKMYFNINTSISPYRLTGEITQGTSTIALDNVYTSFIYPNRYSTATPLSLPSVSAIAGLGFNFNIYKRRIFANMQVGYEYGFAKIHTSNEHKLFDDEKGMYPLVPSGGGIDDNVATRSFMDCISYRRQSLWLEAGLMFKF